MEDILGDPMSEVRTPHSHNPNAEIDKELEQILKKQSARVKVIGVGGGGGNCITRMRENISANYQREVFIDSPSF